MWGWGKSRKRLDEANRELYAKNAELAVRNKTMALLRRIDEAAMSSLEVEAMSKDIARILASEFNYPIIAMAVVDGKALKWKAIACAKARELCLMPETARPIPLANRKNLCATVARSGKRARTDSLPDVLFPSYSRAQVGSFSDALGVAHSLVLPLRADRERVGVLVVGLNRSANDLSEYEREAISGVLNLIVIAIQKARIHESLERTAGKLKAANDKLKELDALKTEFLSIATHQLRTPLAITKGYIAMLSDGMLGTVNAKQRGAIETVSQSNEQLILLVNHLLDLTRIESGRLAVKVEPVDAGKVACWVADFVRPKAKQQGIDLKCKVPVGSFVISADEEKFKDVVMNLVDNAVKYTPKGSVEVLMRKEGADLVLAVKDAGYGMSRADQRHLYEKFARGSASKNVKTSSGLGLYVVHRLVTAMKGEIAAESAGPGKGSTFSVRLPLASPPSSRRKKPAVS